MQCRGRRSSCRWSTTIVYVDADCCEPCHWPCACVSDSSIIIVIISSTAAASQTAQKSHDVKCRRWPVVDNGVQGWPAVAPHQASLLHPDLLQRHHHIILVIVESFACCCYCLMAPYIRGRLPRTNNGSIHVHGRQRLREAAQSSSSHVMVNRGIGAASVNTRRKHAFQSIQREYTASKRDPAGSVVMH